MVNLFDYFVLLLISFRHFKYCRKLYIDRGVKQWFINVLLLIAKSAHNVNIKVKWMKFLTFHCRQQNKQSMTSHMSVWRHSTCARRTNLDRRLYILFQSCWLFSISMIIKCKVISIVDVIFDLYFPSHKAWFFWTCIFVPKYLKSTVFKPFFWNNDVITIGVYFLFYFH